MEYTQPCQSWKDFQTCAVGRVLIRFHEEVGLSAWDIPGSCPFGLRAYYAHDLRKSNSKVDEGFNWEKAISHSVPSSCSLVWANEGCKKFALIRATWSRRAERGMSNGLRKFCGRTSRSFKARAKPGNSLSWSRKWENLSTMKTHFRITVT